MLIELDDTMPSFPSPDMALDQEGGLLCVGGNLEIPTLLSAYSQGIFPWYSEGQPVLWWSPDPRMVLFPEKLHISKSLKKWLKKTPFTVSMNQDFEAVIKGCSDARPDEGTWITDEMKRAYIQLHEAGYAHSVEVWREGELVGGLYGPALGAVFFGESMFSKATNASKQALAFLVETGRYQLIDCQFHTAHLERMGAELIPRKLYLSLLRKWL